MNSKTDQSKVISVFILAMLSLAGCANKSLQTETAIGSVGHRSPSSIEMIPTYDIANLPAEQGETWDPVVDTDKANKIGDSLTKFITKRDAKGPSTHRTFHPKHHGCVMADFSIHSEALPEAYRVGIFAKNTTYQSWIRFSNGNQNGEGAPDIQKDIRGMAVKLLNVAQTPTGSQDFVMCTGKEFFAKGAADYVALNKIAVGGVGNTLAFGIDWLTSQTLRDDVKKVSAATVQIPSPLEANYYSATPYKLGEGNSMKFFVQPCAGQETHALPNPKTADANYLSAVLQSSLSAQSRCFNFYIQPNMNPTLQSIEDPRITWDLQSSPAYPVATITIRPDSDIRVLDNSMSRVNFCENLSFDPWHTRPETRPLGEIGRVRGLLYQRMSMVRHTQNGTTAAGQLPEPRSLDHPCVNEAAVLCQTPHHDGSQSKANE